MKLLLLRPFATAAAVLFSLSIRAQAHPGHSALDWFSAAPHAGHEKEYLVVVSAAALTTLGYGLRWLVTRRR